MFSLAKLGPGVGNLKLLMRPIPAPGPDEVLIEIAGTGICGSDLHLSHGTTMRMTPRSYPLWLGHEYAGTKHLCKRKCESCSPCPRQTVALSLENFTRTFVQVLISAVGSETSEWRVGNPVTAEPSAGCGRCPSCQTGYLSVCPERRFMSGAFAMLITVAAQRVHKLPESLDLRIATPCEPLAC